MFASNLINLAKYFYRKATEPFEVRKSNIHGLGIFATRTINKNEQIGLALVRQQSFKHIIYTRTKLAKYINHADDAANVKLAENGDNYNFKAIRKIEQGEEMFTNYKEYEKMLADTWALSGLKVQVL